MDVHDLQNIPKNADSIPLALSGRLLVQQKEELDFETSELCPAIACIEACAVTQNPKWDECFLSTTYITVLCTRVLSEPGKSHEHRLFTSLIGISL